MKKIDKELFKYLEIENHEHKLYDSKKELIYRNLEVISQFHVLIKDLTNLLEYKSNVSSHYISDMIRKILKVIKQINIKNDKHLKGKHHVDLNIKDDLSEVVIIFEELCKYYYLVQEELSDIANTTFLKAIGYLKEFLINVGIYSISKKDFYDFEKLYFDHNAVNEFVTNSQINITYNLDNDQKSIDFNYLPYYIKTPQKELITKGEVTINIPCLTRKKNK